MMKLYSIDSFDSFRDYFRFVFAREFYRVDANQIPQDKFEYTRGNLEGLGVTITKLGTFLADGSLRNITNPIFITALGIAAIAMVTILFYPTQFVGAVGYVLPAVHSIKPWMLKFGLYLSLQSMTIGMIVRTLGRLRNDQLMQAWTRREIIPIPLGSIIKPRS